MIPQTALTYRNGLFYMRTTYREADLLIASEKTSTVNSGLSEFIRMREAAQDYVESHPEFIYSLKPVEADENAPPAIVIAIEASKRAGVGPMAALPGALADLALDIMLHEGVETAIVENGGEVSMKMSRETIIGVYTGRELNLGIIPESRSRIGVSTSSSRVSHALSFGDADAVVIVAENAALADAVSTRVCNTVKSDCRDSLENAVKLALSIDGVKGCIVYSNDLLSFGGLVKPILLKANNREIFEAMLIGGRYDFILKTV